MFASEKALPLLYHRAPLTIEENDCRTLQLAHITPKTMIDGWSDWYSPGSNNVPCLSSILSFLGKPTSAIPPSGKTIQTNVTFLLREKFLAKCLWLLQTMSCSHMCYQISLRLQLWRIIFVRSTLECRFRYSCMPLSMQNLLVSTRPRRGCAYRPLPQL